jgi:nucleoside-diphosphate-sugar epimerase
MMNILITGINGFVGSVLRASLESKGHQVSGIDVRSSDERTRAVDITDQACVMRHIKELAPDFIFHLAAISRVDYANPSLLYSINVTGTLNLLMASAQLTKKPEFVLVSSSQVYGIVGDADQPITEQAAIKPVNHYGASKASAEHMALVFHHEYGLPVAIVRPFNHIGRGQDPHFVIPKIIAAIREKKREIELGNLSVIRDFLDVRDVVDAYEGIMEHFPDGGTFNIAGGTGYRLSDLLHLILEISGAVLAVKQSGSLMRKNEIVKAIGDSSALQKLNGWRPARTIRDTLEWILSE